MLTDTTPPNSTTTQNSPICDPPLYIAIISERIVKFYKSCLQNLGDKALIMAFLVRAIAASAMVQILFTVFKMGHM